MDKEQKTKLDILIPCERNGVSGWKHGDNGICFIGTDAKQRALKSSAKIKSKLWRVKSKKKRAKERKENRLKKHEIENKGKDRKKNNSTNKSKKPKK